MDKLWMVLLLLWSGGAVAAELSDAEKRAALGAAYPGLFAFEDNALVWADGERMVWDDGREKSAAELIEVPDVEDMFHYAYPRAAVGELTPPQDFDPGRVRHEPFFKKLYGASAAAVEQRVVGVPWFGARLRVTTLLNVDARLAAVAADLSALGPDYAKYLHEPGGGFVWRAIAGTDLLSVHAFGAAVDINTGFADYWRWAGAPEAGPIPYENRMPLEIVAVFESHGFIWGGRWSHYDTMHFEYRPELLMR